METQGCVSRLPLASAGGVEPQAGRSICKTGMMVITETVQGCCETYTE